MHIGIANPRWRGKHSRHSRRMHSPQFYVSGKSLMQYEITDGITLSVALLWNWNLLHRCKVIECRVCSYFRCVLLCELHLWSTTFFSEDHNIRTWQIDISYHPATDARTAAKYYHMLFRNNIGWVLCAKHLHNSVCIIMQLNTFLQDDLWVVIKYRKCLCEWDVICGMLSVVSVGFSLLIEKNLHQFLCNMRNLFTGLVVDGCIRIDSNIISRNFMINTPALLQNIAGF